VSDTQNADTLLQEVHARLGGGVDIQTYLGGLVEIRWRRQYDDGVLSDERYTNDPTLSGALKEVLRHEDRADAADCSEEDEGGMNTEELARELHDVAFTWNHSMRPWDSLTPEEQEWFTDRAERILGEGDTGDAGEEWRTTTLSPPTPAHIYLEHPASTDVNA
jgi:hypothetical protein